MINGYVLIGFLSEGMRKPCELHSPEMLSWIPRSKCSEFHSFSYGKGGTSKILRFEVQGRSQFERGNLVNVESSKECKESKALSI